MQFERLIASGPHSNNGIGRVQSIFSAFALQGRERPCATLQVQVFSVHSKAATLIIFDHHCI